MFVAAALLAACVIGNAASAATGPLPGKEHYNLEHAETLFQEFMVQHNKKYDSVAELFKRFELFKQSLNKVNELNSQFPDTAFKIYHFADLTPEEINNYLGFKISNASAIEAVEPHFPDGFVDPPPAQFDWRDKGVVSHVKEQLDCGSCYIFSAIGNIEGLYAIKHNQCLALSEQQLLDCLKCGSCYGGYMHEVFEELANHKAGCVKEEDYPYVHERRQCKEENLKKIATVTGGRQLTIKTEDVLLQALLQYGPLSIGIDAADFFIYAGGILKPNACSSEAIDHGVLLVGYGEENGEKFWTIKNSWGEQWGEKGYVRILRGVNACGIGTEYTATAEVA